MIYLLRHGEIDTGPDRRFIGWTDLPLNETGRRQAREWRDAFKGVPWKGLFCSDLARSRETAGIIAGASAPFHILEALREISLGSWEGAGMADIRARFPEEWAARGEALDTFRPPGGESFADLEGRVMPAFMKLSEFPVGPLLVVGHAGVNRVILCNLLGIPLTHLFRLEQDYGGLTLIDPSVRPFRVKTLNCRRAYPA
ncbi:histidine phosphatase family protein [Desulfococcus sp.]|uniref:histidine phosphatase family protein n=1 Tax=Desulfococcus sp. TaxID=2025834 RepID=UPI0035941A78